MSSIYNSLVGSHLNYGILVWGSAKEYVLKKLQISQNKVVRTMTFTSLRTNIKKLLRAQKIMNIKELYDFEVSKFMYSMNNEFLPEVFSDYVKPIQHTYSTRHRFRSHYELATPKSDTGKSSIKFFGVKLWGSLENDLKDAGSLNKFKELYKTNLFEND